MSAWPEPASFRDALPVTPKYCKTCQRETPHQIRGGRDVIAVICIPCLSRALTDRLA
jgi:hypothetical protein